MKFVWAKSISPEELTEIVAIHFQALNESFLNNFGFNFVRTIYQELISDPTNLVLIVKEDEHIVAYLVMFLNADQQLLKIITNNWLFFLRQAIRTLLVNPRLLIRALDSKDILQSHDEKGEAEIQFFAVDKNFLGKGTGTKMIRELNDRLKRLMINHYLVGTKKNNPLSNRFYLKNGFIFTHELKIFGETLNYYRSPVYRESRKIPPTTVSTPRSFNNVSGSLRKTAPRIRSPKAI